VTFQREQEQVVPKGKVDAKNPEGSEKFELRRLSLRLIINYTSCSMHHMTDIGPMKILATKKILYVGYGIVHTFGS